MYKRQVLPFPAGDSLATVPLRTVREDATDSRYLWLATYAGLCQLDKQTRQRRWFFPKNDLPYLPDNVLNYLEPSPDGTLWVSFGINPTLGIGRFDPKKGVFERLAGEFPVQGLQQRCV